MLLPHLVPPCTLVFRIDFREMLLQAVQHSLSVIVIGHAESDYVLSSFGKNCVHCSTEGLEMKIIGSNTNSEMKAMASFGNNVSKPP